jgi:type II secretory pathway pseudopilin PulG
MKRARGFTLIELLCYLALVTAGLMVIAGLELAASRALFLERALVDMTLEADSLASNFRDDLMEASRVEGPEIAGGKGCLLGITLTGGSAIQWYVEHAKSVRQDAAAIHLESPRLTRRTLAKQSPQPLGVAVFSHIERLDLVRLPSGRMWRLDVTFARSRADEVGARRSYTVTASTLCEGSP